MTAGFSYGAYDETLIFVTGTSGNILSPGRQKPKSAVYIQKTKEIGIWYPVLRSKPQWWIPELRFGYPPLRKFSKSFWENSKFS